MATPAPNALEDQARRVYSYFVFRLRQPEEAEHLARLTLERARRVIDRREEDELDPDLRLFRAARAVIGSHPRRRETRKVEPESRDPETAPGGATALSGELAIGIGRLHARERDAIALRFGGELVVDQIAELLDRTPADVKQRIARVVRSLSELGVLPGERPASGALGQRTGAGGAEERQRKQG